MKKNKKLKSKKYIMWSKLSALGKTKDEKDWEVLMSLARAMHYGSNNYKSTDSV